MKRHKIYILLDIYIQLLRLQLKEGERKERGKAYMEGGREREKGREEGSNYF